MWGWVSTNQAINAAPPRLVKLDLSPPDVEQVGNLIRAATQCEPCFGHFVHLAATTGARRGELCALRWGNVNFETGELLIERALVQVGCSKKIALTMAPFVAQRQVLRQKQCALPS